MARTREGTLTGTVALPRPVISYPETTFDLGVQPAGSYTSSVVTIPARTSGLPASVVGALGGGGDVLTSYGFNSIGSGIGTIPGVNPLAGALITIGADITTAILNRGNQTAASPAAAAQLPAPVYRGVIPGQDPLPPVPVESVNGQPAQWPTGMMWPTTKDGRPRRMRKDGRPWKRPSMNPANPRALGRSMRRVNAFAAIAKRTISFTKRVRMKKRKRT